MERLFAGWMVYWWLLLIDGLDGLTDCVETNQGETKRYNHLLEVRKDRLAVFRFLLENSIMFVTMNI